ncbi:lipase member K-like [Dermatophagoides pteronyssinus]|uniref:lipase member K-like n=1 Tax=Dermatophagoides pteronyssinus TaxID=6956 RepID=UPI003F67E8A7
MSAVRLLKIFPNSHHWSCGIFSLMIIIIIIVANYPTESSLPLFVDNDNNNGDLMINATAMDIDDVHRDIFQLIKSRGFEFEQHFVTTSDGYILQLVRIINPKIIDDRQPNKHGKPIILFHGFQLTGSSFLVTSAGRLMNDGHYYEFDENGHLQQPNDTDVGNTLGFVLADRGYDVWLANYRGSIYSNNHIKFNPKSMLLNDELTT